MLSYELREQVLDYISNHIDLESLEDWYVPRLRQFLQDPNSADAAVVAAIELAAVHLANGIQDEDEIKDMLGDVLSEYSQAVHLDLTEPALHASAGELRLTTRTSSRGDRPSIMVPFLMASVTLNSQT